MLGYGVAYHTVYKTERFHEGGWMSCRHPREETASGRVGEEAETQNPCLHSIGCYSQLGYSLWLFSDERMGDCL